MRLRPKSLPIKMLIEQLRGKLNVKPFTKLPRVIPGGWERGGCSRLLPFRGRSPGVGALAIAAEALPALFRILSISYYIIQVPPILGLLVGFASTVQLKDAQGLKGNAIRSEKNLIFCFPTRCQDVRCQDVRCQHVRRQDGRCMM